MTLTGAASALSPSPAVFDLLRLLFSCIQKRRSLILIGSPLANKAQPEHPPPSRRHRDRDASNSNEKSLSCKPHLLLSSRWISLQRLTWLMLIIFLTSGPTRARAFRPLTAKSSPAKATAMATRVLHAGSHLGNSAAAATRFSTRTRTAAAWQSVRRTALLGAVSGGLGGGSSRRYSSQVDSQAAPPLAVEQPQPAQQHALAQSHPRATAETGVTTSPPGSGSRLRMDPRKDISGLITVVSTPERAREVLAVLKMTEEKDQAAGKSPSARVWAADTEVAYIDVKTQGPVGNGRVICLSLYGGPDVDFGDGPGSAVWVDNFGAAEGVLQVPCAMRNALFLPLLFSSSFSSSFSLSSCSSLSSLSPCSSLSSCSSLLASRIDHSLSFLANMHASPDRNALIDPM